MKKQFAITKIFVSIVLAAVCVSANAKGEACASRLASGKWVKVEIPSTGMYELTAGELSAMGFNDITRVRIYGQGGYVLSERFDGSATDDLTQVPVGRTADKIYFYAKGTVDLRLNTGTSPRYTRTLNTYSSSGYYFVTEADDTDLLVANASVVALGKRSRPTSLNCFYHEQDEYSFYPSGRDLFGEKFVADSLQLSVTLPDINNAQPVVAQTAVAAASSNTDTSLKAYLNGVGIPFNGESADIYFLLDDELYYRCAPVGMVTTGKLTGNDTLTIKINDQGVVSSCVLDYAMLSYYRYNRLGSNAQMRLGYADFASDDKVVLYDMPATGEVWNITSPAMPYREALHTVAEPDSIAQARGYTGAVMAFSSSSRHDCEFVAFDPAAQLGKVASFQPVANQNIHALPTPDYVIISQKNLRRQAERLAKLHREHDGIDVLVVDQDCVFNEFSSGTPDATAYRLMLKMFYDRNPEKLKHLLLFGAGYYDNRQVQREIDKNYLLTYQSAGSDNKMTTYVTDDYFGMLADGSGVNVLSDKLTIGVGRLTPRNEDEADAIVDKIEGYMLSVDYSNWRNKALVIADDHYSGSEYIHMYQGIDAENRIAASPSTLLDLKHLHVSSYVLKEDTYNPVLTKGADNKWSAKLQMKNFLQEGAWLVSYIGHGGAASLSKRTLWSVNDVKSASVSRLPIMTIMACDIYDYDGDSRGLGEEIMQMPNGGAIALVTATRTVDAYENAVYNRSFVDALLNNNPEGTIGGAYKVSKQQMAGSSRNKMCFSLFGDPALRISFPKPYISVNQINGVDVADTVTVKPMTKIAVAGVVRNSSGNTDTSYNGEVTVSLYDAQTAHSTFTYSGNEYVNYDNRPLLAEVNAKVVAGQYSASVLVPKSCKTGEVGEIRMYAHDANNGNLTDGAFGGVLFGDYDASDDATIVDSISPSITRMYINDEATFTNDMNVPATFTLYVEASDNVALSNQQMLVGNNVKLVLDGTTTCDNARGYVSANSDGTSAVIAVPFYDITAGQHTLTITVTDAAGNTATQTISFIVVDDTKEYAVIANDMPVKDSVTFSITPSLSAGQTFVVNVFDSNDKPVWKSAANTTEFEWDLVDSNGEKLRPGVYKYYGTIYDNASLIAGTKITTIVVID